MPMEKVQSSEKPKKVFQWSWQHFQVFTWMAAVPAITHNRDIGSTFSVYVDQLETISSDLDRLLCKSPRTRFEYSKCPSCTLRKTEELLSSTLPEGTHEHSDGRKCKDASHEFWMSGGLDEAPRKFMKIDDARSSSRSPSRSACGVHLHEEKVRFVQGAKALYCFFLPLEYNRDTHTKVEYNTAIHKKYWGAVYGLVEVSKPIFNLKQAA